MARSTKPPAAPQSAHLTPQQMHSGITRLQKRIADLQAFDVSQIRASFSPAVKALETSIEATLSSVFGKDTVEYNRYHRATNLDHYRMFIGGSAASVGEVQHDITENKATALALLQQAVRDLEEELEHQPGVPAALKPVAASSAGSNKVFLVHGRDNEAKNEVARFLEKIGLEVIILHERPNLGRHLLTKFQEEAGDVGFAVILITPDDEGGLSGGSDKEPRARQNVIFELGFFIGKLGASHVAPLVKGDVVRPSDFDGIGYIGLDATGGWKGLLARELKGAKVPFDAMKVFEA
ncbi:TIR domain-containing protein [Rhizobium leguminosarum]|uniref:TIR domain-containing protein n=1 Tax=Rhizobium leguminosarum TaxID=384 RepID=UPI0014424641|nr:nucleotide-binding protein [Rhizobium leguminosarum]NKL59713.1 nucleotide-binding protein [Rhizobium leguminosarum bv. viciae]